MSDLPKLVQDDPWLTPYADHIRGRQQRLSENLEKIKSTTGGLKAHALAHRFAGIHLQPDGHWMVREWLPGAQAVSLIGDFNDWNSESHPLVRAERGIWQLRLPGDALKHGELPRIFIQPPLQLPPLAQ